MKVIAACMILFLALPGYAMADDSEDFDVSFDGDPELETGPAKSLYEQEVYWDPNAPVKDEPDPTFDNDPFFSSNGSSNGSSKINGQSLSVRAPGADPKDAMKYFGYSQDEVKQMQEQEAAGAGMLTGETPQSVLDQYDRDQRSTFQTFLDYIRPGAPSKMTPMPQNPQTPDYRDQYDIGGGA